MFFLRKFIAITLILFSFAISAQAKTLKIVGNKRIETGTILSYFDNERLGDFEYLNNVIKQLYATEIFADINITENSDEVVVDLVENPLINEIKFSGNKKLDSEVILQEIDLAPRANFTKAKLSNDLLRIIEIYKRSGRINVEVKPKVKFLEQNRIDLIFKINENDNIKVKYIEFTGNERFLDKNLKDVISTKEDKWYRSRSANYDPDRVLYDKELLRRFYLNNGYVDIRIYDNLVEYFPRDKFFLLSFFLEEGKKYFYSGFKIESQFKNISMNKINEIIEKYIKPEELFKLEQIEKAQKDVSEFLSDKGFAFADIDYEINKTDEDKVEIDFFIKRNQKVFIKNIVINGNTRTYDEVIRRELKIKEGDPFNASKIKRSKQRITNLGFFNSVMIEQKANEDPAYIDLEIKVSERPTGELNFGLGYSTTERFLGNISIKERNLLGKAHTIFLTTQKSSISDEIDLAYKIPNFLDYNMNFGFDIFDIKTEYEESLSDLKTRGFGLELSYNISEYLNHRVKYSWKINDITDVDESASRYIKDQEGETLQSSIINSFYYDKRDNRLNPTDGYVIKYSNEFAGIGGGVDFFKEELGLLDVNSFFDKKLILQKILKVGHILALNGDEVRINNRFFLGGSSFRGFANAGIGPRDSDDNAALGGEFFWTGSLELSFPIGLPEELGFKASVFTDFGTLTHIEDQNDVDIVDSGDIRASTGIGINWDSPLGPIRFDFVKAIAKDDLDKTENFRISFGTNF